MRRYVSMIGISMAVLSLFFISAWIAVWWGTAGKTVTVPDLHDKNVVDALKDVGKIGLDLRVIREEHSSEIPRNEIITQYPKPGTKLKVDRNIEIVLSLGLRDIAIPDVRRISLRKADLILQQNGISPGRSTLVFAEGEQEDHVLSQNPMPLAENFQENTVNLMVSIGPRVPEYRMPDLIGMEFDQAVALMESAGLTVANVRYEEYPGARANQVTNQTPQFGYPASRKTPIALVVNKQEASLPAATVIRVPFSYRIPLRIPFPIATDVFIEDRQGKRQIYAGRKLPGSTLELTLDISGDAVVEVYLNGRVAHSRDYR